MKIKKKFKKGDHRTKLWRKEERKEQKKKRKKKRNPNKARRRRTPDEVDEEGKREEGEGCEGGVGKPQARDLMRCGASKVWIITASSIQPIKLPKSAARSRNSLKSSARS